MYKGQLTKGGYVYSNLIMVDGSAADTRDQLSNTVTYLQSISFSGSYTDAQN